jgi:hypothetical protein
LIAGYGLLTTVPTTAFATAIFVLTLKFGLDIESVGDYSSKSYFFVRQTQGDDIRLLGFLSAVFSILAIPAILYFSGFLYGKGVKQYSRSEGSDDTQDMSLLLRVLHGSPVAYLSAIRRSLRKPVAGRRQIRIAVVISTILLVIR